MIFAPNNQLFAPFEGEKFSGGISRSPLITPPLVAQLQNQLHKIFGHQVPDLTIQQALMNCINSKETSFGEAFDPHHLKYGLCLITYDGKISAGVRVQRGMGTADLPLGMTAFGEILTSGSYNHATRSKLVVLTLSQNGYCIEGGEDLMLCEFYHEVHNIKLIDNGRNIQVGSTDVLTARNPSFQADPASPSHMMRKLESILPREKFSGKDLSLDNLLRAVAPAVIEQITNVDFDALYDIIATNFDPSFEKKRLKSAYHKAILASAFAKHHRSASGGTAYGAAILGGSHIYAGTNIYYGNNGQGFCGERASMSEMLKKKPQGLIDGMILFSGSYNPHPDPQVNQQRCFPCQVCQAAIKQHINPNGKQLFIFLNTTGFVTVTDSFNDQGNVMKMQFDRDNMSLIEQTNGGVETLRYTGARH